MTFFRILLLFAMMCTPTTLFMLVAIQFEGFGTLVQALVPLELQPIVLPFLLCGIGFALAFFNDYRIYGRHEVRCQCGR